MGSVFQEAAYSYQGRSISSANRHDSYNQANRRHQLCSRSVTFTGRARVEIKDGARVEIEDRGPRVPDSDTNFWRTHCPVATCGSDAHLLRQMAAPHLRVLHCANFGCARLDDERRRHSTQEVSATNGHHSAAAAAKVLGSRLKVINR